jgi:hypothetical protein
VVGPVARRSEEIVMGAALVLIASFVMIFFIALIFSGILLGLTAAIRHFVGWVVAPTADNDPLARPRTAKSLSGHEK